MKKIIKFFKKKIYLIAGIAYLGVVALSFVFMLPFTVKMINSSLPGGSQAAAPPLTFNTSDYKKIEDKIGVPLPEFKVPVSEPRETAPGPVPAPEAAPPAVEPPTIEPPATEPLPPEQEEEEVPAPVLDKASFNISILNGSGVTGAAAKLRTALEADGFKVSKVGNTAEIQKSRLEIKETRKDFESAIRSVIESSYVVHEVKTLEETDSADAIFIIGKE